MAKRKKAAKKTNKAKNKSTKAAENADVQDENEVEGVNLSAPDADGYQKVYRGSGASGGDIPWNPEEPGDSIEGFFFDQFYFDKKDPETGEVMSGVEGTCYKILDPRVQGGKVHMVFDSYVITQFFENDPGIDQGQWIRLIYKGKKPTSSGSGRTVKLFDLAFNAKLQKKWEQKARALIKEMKGITRDDSDAIPF